VTSALRRPFQLTSVQTSVTVTNKTNIFGRGLIAVPFLQVGGVQRSNKNAPPPQNCRTHILSKASFAALAHSLAAL